MKKDVKTVIKSTEVREREERNPVTGDWINSAHFIGSHENWVVKSISFSRQWKSVLRTRVKVIQNEQKQQNNKSNQHHNISEQNKTEEKRKKKQNNCENKHKP